MKELEVTPNRLVFTWASIITLILIVLIYVFEIVGVSQDSKLNYVSYLPFVFGVFIVIKSHRDQDLDGYISFKRAFSAGFRYSSLLSLMLGLFMLIYLKWLNPSVMEKGMIVAENQMLDQGKSQGEVDAAMDIARRWGPVFAALRTSIMYTLTGALISVIFALGLKKENPGFDSTDYETPEEDRQN